MSETTNAPQTGDTPMTEMTDPADGEIGALLDAALAADLAYLLEWYEAIKDCSLGSAAPPSGVGDTP